MMKLSLSLLVVFFVFGVIVVSANREYYGDAQKHHQHSQEQKALQPLQVSQHVVANGGSKARLPVEDDVDVEKPAGETDMLKSRRSKLRAGSDPTVELWPKGKSGLYEVPYYIEKDGFTEHQKNNIRFAYKILNRSTNLKFIELDDESRNSRYHLDIVNGTWCKAHVGYENDGSYDSQELQLYDHGSKCRSLATIVHETLHVLGGRHEHQRPDRDSYVKVYETSDHDYIINPDLRTDIPYDLASILQYGWSEGKIEAIDASLKLVQDSKPPTPSSCDYAWLNTIYPGEKPAPPCVPGVVMLQCETLPEYKGDAKAEEHCRYKCGKYMFRQDEDQTVYCQFLGGADMPIDAVTEYMKGKGTDTTTTTETPKDSTSTEEKTKSHETETHKTKTHKTKTHKTKTKSTKPDGGDSSDSGCCVLAQWANVAGMADWCDMNGCPPTQCYEC